jgi:NRAMP (natural resistance-associated macrophage protein)-like metal ion transporter
VSKEQTPQEKHTVLQSLGLGLITGAADDDCSAIGTFAQAGAQFGYKILWTAPATFPMLVTVVYLSGKLGQVTGQGLFSTMRLQYPRWLVYAVLLCVIIGNTIEAAADIGGIAAAAGSLVHLPHWLTVICVSAATLVLQVWGSYGLIRNVFRVLALSLLAYIASAFMAHPNIGEVIRGTLVPSLHFDRDSVSILVAIIGTSLSAYLFTWQSNEEVEEKVIAGKHKLWERRGTTAAKLRTSLWDVIFGMFFSNLVMYFTILATAATLFVAGKHKVETAMDAAQSLTPLAGPAAGLLFAVGIVGVGFLAIPVMTTGAAYDVSQALGWKNGLYRKPGEAKRFYGTIAIITAIATALNFLGINPMRALVVAGIVQGLSTPPLMMLIMFMTNDKSIMGDHVNGRLANVCGSITTLIVLSASVALIFLWLRH